MIRKLASFSLIILLSISAAYGADKSGKEKNLFNGTAIGLAGGAGISHAFPVEESAMDWRVGPAVHVGLIFEKMFTNRWGLHTGFWVKYSEIFFSDDAVTPDGDLEMFMLEVPIDAIISFNSGFFSFNILAGLTLSQVLHSKAHNNDAGGSADFLHSTNQFQMALDLGCIFKFRVGTYTDLFIGLKSQLYLLPLMDDFKGHEDNFVYGAHAFAGIMFRMSTFPY